MAMKSTKSLIESVSEHKEFKKVMRMKKDVLALFINDVNQSSDMVKVLGDVSLKVNGVATVLTVDCNDKESKKLCKKLRVAGGKSYSLKHYKDGDLHKNYDRDEKTKSLVTFLEDPAGDLPWEEDPQAQEVMHLASPAQLAKLLKAEKGPVLFMFYSPWCGHCKSMEPDFMVVAKEKSNAVLAAMDMNRLENSPVSRKYNINVFPTDVWQARRDSDSSEHEETGKGTNSAGEKAARKEKDNEVSSDIEETDNERGKVEIMQLVEQIIKEAKFLAVKFEDIVVPKDIIINQQKVNDNKEYLQKTPDKTKTSLLGLVRNVNEEGYIDGMLECWVNPE